MGGLNGKPIVDFTSTDYSYMGTSNQCKTALITASATISEAVR